MISFWAVLLLVLATSPLTAPFSSCSVLDLLADRELQNGALVQAKNFKNDSTATPDRTPLLLFSNIETDGALLPQPRSTQRHCTIQTALRL